LVGTTKVYPGVGADIVMESISLIDVPKGCFCTKSRSMSVIEMLRQLRAMIDFRRHPYESVQADATDPEANRTA
jgi:hypothetical protein